MINKSLINATRNRNITQHVSHLSWICVLPTDSKFFCLFVLLIKITGHKKAEPELKVWGRSLVSCEAINLKWSTLDFASYGDSYIYSTLNSYKTCHFSMIDKSRGYIEKFFLLSVEFTTFIFATKFPVIENVRSFSIDSFF